MFLKGSFVKCYDLSCSGDSSLTEQIPAVKTGRYTCNITFEGQTITETALLSFQEFPSVIEISKNNTVTTSYLT